MRKKVINNFEICSHKDVELKRNEGDRTIVGATLACPQVEDRNVHVEVSSWGAFADKRFKKDISTGWTDDATGEKYVAYQSVGQAYAHLGSTATVQLCETCPLATMSPREVATYRANQAEERLFIAREDIRRREALLQLNDALHELDGMPKPEIISPQTPSELPQPE
jgi:hypothetical protein